MAPSPITLRKVSGLRAALEREFPHVPTATIDAYLAGAVEALLEQARFEDYVPLLAHRRVREHLHAAGRSPIGLAEASRTIAA